ncbi:hypothetical protein KI387_026607, partial [Taxus chinensis]
ADQETDEVYAQVTLVPEPEPLEKDVGAEDDEEVAKDKPTPHMFCKTLTASDTSTHGGFSVPRRAAEDCFPPLDYNQQRPSQELLAKDLHGVEWKFRHIYRGQPRRHLLTTGWSVFVSHKGLVSGDAVLFMRDENGELRLGIRRAARQQGGVPSSVLSSQNMHLSVLAAAANAVATKSMFHIFYNPRTSPAEFVIPYHKYLKRCKQPLSVGMRFKMRFETEDAAERRYTGIITAISDADPARWPGSKWRSLKVGWDEHTGNERQERVSPWEIEPSISVAGLNVSSGTRLKRLKTTPSTTPVDVALPDGGRLLDFGESIRFQKVLQGQENVSFNAPIGNDGAEFMKGLASDHRGCDVVPEGLKTARMRNEIWSSQGRSEISSRLSDLSESVRFQKVLQGQEIMPSKSPHTKTGVDLIKHQLWDSKRREGVAEGFGGAWSGHKNWPSLGRSNIAPFPELLGNKDFGHSYGSNRLFTMGFSHAQFSNTNNPDSNFFPQSHSGENSATLPMDNQRTSSIPWTSSQSSPFDSRERNVPDYCSSLRYPSYRITDSETNDLYGDYWQPLNHGNSAKLDAPRMTVGWQATSVLPSVYRDTQPSLYQAKLPSNDSSEGRNKLMEASMIQHQLSTGTHSMDAGRGVIQGKQSCKIFGFSLIDESSCMADTISSSTRSDHVTQEGSTTLYGNDRTLKPSALRNPDSPMKDSLKQCDQPKDLKGSEEQIALQTVSNVPNIIQASGRKCTKVHKQGNVVGRAVDLSKLDGYDQLIRELERLFNMEGLLNDPDKGWQVVYTDSEDDMMLVGDDPWQEFCNMVCKILIYTHDEVQKMRPGMFSDDGHSCSEEQPSVIEVSKSSIDRQDSSSPLIT